VVAALLSLLVSTTPAHGALAAIPTPVGSVPAAPSFPSRPAVALDSATFDTPDPDPAPPAVAPIVLTAVPFAAPRSTARPAARSVVVRAAARPARMWAQLRKGFTVTGLATWYGGTRGYAGIPHVAMPGARFLPRGRTAPRARVCVDGRCITVQVVDACACSVGTRQARIVDLSVTALGRLGLDPRRGVYQVRITLLAP
jgi:hypothetical protein